MNQGTLSRKDDRKNKSVDNAKRYKTRMRNEHNWFEIQARENEDRIQHLEGKIQSLSKELSKSPEKKKPRNQHTEKRPSWFGEPF